MRCITLYFNPRSPQGERPGGAVFVCTRFQFQSPLPAWGATQHLGRNFIGIEFQSTLPAWGATIPIASKIWPLVISIHAPRRESDFVVYDCQTGFTKFQSTLPAWGATHHSISRFIYNDFNPRSPQGERRNQEPVDIVTITFQSTLPAGGATRGGKRDWRCYRHFNPRSPQGERLRFFACGEYGDKFQSTLPAGGAT